MFFQRCGDFGAKEGLVLEKRPHRIAQNRRSRPRPGFYTPGIDENLAKLLERETRFELATLIRKLVDAAIASDRGRYGDIASVSRHPGDDPSASIKTTTGVDIEFDWTTLALQQSGRDTRRIDALYRIHYLQWTGVRSIDRVVGAGGPAPANAS